MFSTEDWDQSKITDQSGKTFLITGSNAGLGFEAAKVLSANKGHVIMATRNPDKAMEAIAEIKKEVGEQVSLEFLHLDLTDFSSVKRAAAKLEQRPINVLVNNASVAAPKDDIGRKTIDGFEITMQTNFFGPRLFTKLLTENVRSATPSRIIWQAASGESMAKLNWDDLKGEQKDDSTLLGEYAQTKLMNIMIAREMNNRLQGSGIDVLACQPGVSHSAIYSKADTSKADVKAIDINQKVAGQSQERGATALLYSCTSDDLTGKGFSYIGPKYFTGPINLNIGQTKDRDPKNPEANNPIACARLYDMTEEILQPFY
ncbi:hypothetical protein WJX74_006078 [Apatococcus lobatus]|uniref:Uncharacterized protein n=1 Tax=Apatococcus lobatus TaxID=904363 RepID=A0AAW1RYM1_9CHLO